MIEFALSIIGTIAAALIFGIIIWAIFSSIFERPMK